jgi:hypothetical protein
MLNKIVYRICLHVVIYQERNSCKIVIQKNLLLNDYMEEQDEDGKIMLSGW